MGKGDRRTKKGKIVKSSFGKSRPKKQRNVLATKASYNPSNTATASKEEE